MHVWSAKISMRKFIKLKQNSVNGREDRTQIAQHAQQVHQTLQCCWRSERFFEGDFPLFIFWSLLTTKIKLNLWLNSQVGTVLQILGSNCSRHRNIDNSGRFRHTSRGVLCMFTKHKGSSLKVHQLFVCWRHQKKLWIIIQWYLDFDGSSQEKQLDLRV